MSVSNPPFPRWMSQVLWAAAIYNLLWGAWVILLPNSFFDWTGMTRPNYPQIWQCVGMIVGVYGIGYACAALNPIRHWPIVLVGFLGKIFGPIGFVQAMIEGSLPIQFGYTILTNDLIWWVPFFLILRAAWRHHLQDGDASTPRPPEAIMAEAKTQTGATLLGLSLTAPTLVVFLRHFG
jgi:hypothetical protein